MLRDLTCAPAGYTCEPRRDTTVQFAIRCEIAGEMSFQLAKNMSLQ
jgi:hypothetical protein